MNQYNKLYFVLTFSETKFPCTGTFAQQFWLELFCANLSVDEDFVSENIICDRRV